MRRILIALVAAAAACVEVPPHIQAHFAGAGPDDRSNYRPGRHGVAPPNEDPTPREVGDAGAPDGASPATVATPAGDAGAAVAASDGGNS